jgi:hypothetical protein
MNRFAHPASFHKRDDACATIGFVERSLCMSASTLERVKNLVTLLSPKETKELLDYLNSQLAQDSTQKNTKKMLLEDLWQISDEFALREAANSETMTQEFLRTRR